MTDERTMKTWADIKRRVQVGTVMECVENTLFPDLLNGSRRTITKVQTQAWRFDWNPNGGESQAAWLPFPAAKDVSIIDADTFQIALGPDHHLTLRFVP